MKIDRLIGIITLLLQKEKLTAPQLAARFEVSRRTINRDIEDLCRAGIPVITTQGYGGGISIASGYTIDRSLLSRDELQTILAGLGALESVSRETCLHILSEKLSVKPDCVDAGVFSIDLASYYRTPLAEKIECLKAAISARRCVSFSYYAPSGESYRMVEPYRILFCWSSWYVFAYCRNRRDFRTFKLNRLCRLRECEEVYEPRPIPEEKLRAQAWLDEEKYRLEAVFARSVRWRLIEEYGPDCYTETPEGLHFSCGFASYEAMFSWILSFGDRVHILTPENLREDRLRQAKNIIEQERNMT